MVIVNDDPFWPQSATSLFKGHPQSLLCVILVDWGVYLLAVHQHVESNYFYVSKCCPIYILFLVLLVCPHFLCGPTKCISPFGSFCFSSCYSGFVFCLHWQVSTPTQKCCKAI